MYLQKIYLNNMEIDETDKKILRMLQVDARMTNKELASHLDLTLTPVYERVRKLERKGIIRKYAAILNPQKIGKNLIAFLSIQMAQHNEQSIQAIEKAVEMLPEVLECYHIAGENDYLLKVLIRDMEDYENFIRKKLINIQHMGHIRSSFVMAVIKDKNEIEI